MSEREPESVTLVGERNSWHAGRIRSFLDRNIHPYLWVDADSPEGEAFLESISPEEREKQPILVLPDGDTVPQPTNVALARLLGIASEPSSEQYDLVIVGAGPAGLAAAVYGASEGLSTALIEREAPGGQAGTSSRIENYLGFSEGVTGADLTREATKQAKRFGVDFVQPTMAIRLGAEGANREVEISRGHTVLHARSVVVATGVEYRRLPAPGVADLLGSGVRYGAHARDADELEGKEAIVIGGANSAGQAAVHFSGYAERVRVLVRADSLAKSMSNYLIEKIEAIDNIEVMTSTELREARGDDCLQEILVTRAGEEVSDPLRADALFIFIGAQPYTDWLEGAIARDERGFILAGPDLSGANGDGPRWPLERDPYVLESSMPGVFVAGDNRRGSIKRVASAVGEGSMAVQLVHRYLSEGP